MWALISLGLPLILVWSLMFQYRACLLAYSIQYLLQSANYMPGTVLGTRESMENKGRHDPSFPDV